MRKLVNGALVTTYSDGTEDRVIWFGITEAGQSYEVFRTTKPGPEFWGSIGGRMPQPFPTGAAALMAVAGLVPTDSKEI